MKGQRMYSKTGPIRFADVCKSALLSPASGERLWVGSVEIGNGTAGAIRLGWGYKLPDAQWIAGQWDHSATGEEFIDDTVDAQDAGTNDFLLADKDNANDGFAVAARDKFNVIGITLGTAGGSAGTVVYEYWNGSAWASLGMIGTPMALNASPGDGYISFFTPPDWAPFAAATSGIPAGYYAVRVKATTAPTTTSPLASVLWVCRLLDYVESCDAGKSILWGDNGEQRIPFGASIVAYASTADNENWVNIEYTQGP